MRERTIAMHARAELIASWPTVNIDDGLVVNDMLPTSAPFTFGWLEPPGKFVAVIDAAAINDALIFWGLAELVALLNAVACWIRELIPFTTDGAVPSPETAALTRAMCPHI